jgi:hypothetical protein
MPKEMLQELLLVMDVVEDVLAFVQMLVLGHVHLNVQEIQIKK